jgi:cytochrome b6-f complex iron-sulfur subunit
MSLANPSDARANQVKRRQFLGWALAAAGAALVVQAGVAFYQFIKPQTQAGGFGGTVNAGNVKEFRVGSVNTVREMHGFVVRDDKAGALTLSWKCTHLGCTVPWVENEHQFHCPCHGSIFNTKGQVMAGPAPRPLDLYPSRVENNELVVDTSQVITRTNYDPSQLTPFPPGA